MVESIKQKEFHKLHKDLLGKLKELQKAPNQNGWKEVLSLAGEMGRQFDHLWKDSLDEIELLRGEIKSYKAREREINDSLKDLMFVLRASCLLREAEQPKEMMKTLGKLARMVLPLKEIELFVPDAEQDALVPLVNRRGSQRLRRLVKSNLEDGIMDWVLTDGEVRIVSESEILDSNFHAEGNNSYIYVPLVLRGESIGVLVMYTEVPRDRITRQRIEILRLITEQAVSAIEKIRLSNKLEDSVRILNEFRRLSEKAEREVTAKDR